MAKPLAQMASKPARSMSRALNASCAPTALIAPGRFRSARSFTALFIAPHHAKARICLSMRSLRRVLKKLIFSPAPARRDAPYSVCCFRVA
jgi:hypothetical protein